MPTPEQALDELARENERLGLTYDDVPLPGVAQLDALLDHLMACITKCVISPDKVPEDVLRAYAQDYGQQCAKAARAKALEEAAQWYLSMFGGTPGTIGGNMARFYADQIRALAAAEVA